VCKSKHNTLVHSEKSQFTNSTQVDEKQVSAHHTQVAKQEQILLSTYIVEIIDNFGIPFPCRALLDSGSEACFMTDRFAQTLCIKNPKQVFELLV
jgi:hypothetical protein